MGSLAGRHVLVVEDEYFIADDLAKALAASGAQVLGPVSTQDDALRLLDSRQPDLAILDINLKGTVGFAVADELARRAIPFVFATGYDANSLPDRHADRPRWQKPFSIDDLLASLAGTL